MKRYEKYCTVADALHSALAEYGLEKGIKEQEVFLRWEEIVGKAIANNARPSRLDQGKLWIRVNNAGWRQELSLMRVELINKINLAIGAEIVKEVILR
jgi:predicted nucleic acid-binding Zn ribbon protein